MALSSRKYQRYSIVLPAEFRDASQGNSPSKITIMNIGAEGLCIVSKRFFNIESIFEIKVRLNPKEEVTFKTEVIWISKKGNNYNIGLKIIDSTHSDEAKFIKFYCSKILTLVED